MQGLALPSAATVSAPCGIGPCWHGAWPATTARCMRPFSWTSKDFARIIAPLPDLHRKQIARAGAGPDRDDWASQAAGQRVACVPHLTLPLMRCIARAYWFNGGW